MSCYEKQDTVYSIGNVNSGSLTMHHSLAMDILIEIG